MSKSDAGEEGQAATTSLLVLAQPSGPNAPDVGAPWHAPTGHHPERPARLAAALAGLQRSGVATRACEGALAADADLLRVHHADYLQRGREGRPRADRHTYLREASWTAAQWAAGSVLRLLSTLVDSPNARGLALVRPPGHHAHADRAMGFCLLNNVAIAAAWVRHATGRRVAIFDLDAHHGDGTQSIFWRDAGVFFASVHERDLYPGGGTTDECGEGPGLGLTLNVPLRAGAGDETYRAVLDRVLLPALEDFAPEVVLVSLGFDSCASDPLSHLATTPQGVAAMVHSLSVAARRLHAPLCAVLEGGYDLPAIALGTQCCAQALQGVAPQVPVDHTYASHRQDVEHAAASARKFRHARQRAVEESRS